MEERGLFKATDQLLVLKDIAEALNQANDINAAMVAILPKLSEALGLRTAWAFRYDEKQQSFVEVGASGLPEALDGCHQAALRYGGCECQSQFVRQELHQAVNIVRCSRLKSAAGDKQNLHFHASIPLRSKDKALGILNVAAQGMAVFTNEALAFLQTVGQQVAVAVDRARLLQDERTRAEKLQAIHRISASFRLDTSPEVLFQRACETFVGIGNYEVCGVTIESEGCEPDVMAVAESEHMQDVGKDALGLEAVTSPITTGILLTRAMSVLTEPLPLTPYTIRVESPVSGEFDDLDRELIQSFAKVLATAYVNIVLHQQGLSEAHWAERRRIAADLHDAVSQRLFSAQLLLRTALEQLNNQDESLRLPLTRVSELIAESQGEMRGLIRALRPPLNTTLLQEVQKRVRTLSLGKQTVIQLEAPPSLLWEPAPAIRDSLLSIVDEALHNAMRHADARKVIIQVVESDDRMILRIRDNGRGFTQETCVAGLGTQTMLERAKSFGGRTVITSGEDGTTVSVELPRQH